jgi:WD40 repeat protein
MNILDLSFNQATSHLCCSTNRGFIIYKLSPKVEKRIFTELHKGVGIMKMLNSSNLSVMVGGGDDPFRPDNTLVVWDDHKKSSILEIEIKESDKNASITNALITNDCVVVLIENKIRICSLNDGSHIAVKETYTNKLGLCEISTKYDKSTDTDKLKKIVTLGHKKGEVSVWDVESDEYKIIKAHDNELAALALNHDGSLIATTSEVGTNVHVYETATSKLLYKFRRGTTSANVYDLCFDKRSDRLACCSRNGTVHIFNLNNSENLDDTKNITSMLSSFKEYLPEYFSSQWSSQKAYLDDTSKAITSFDSLGVLHIVTYNGNYYRISGNDGKYDTVNKSFLYPDQN